MLKSCGCKIGRSLEKSHIPKPCLSCEICMAAVSAKSFLISNSINSQTYPHGWRTNSKSLMGRRGRNELEHTGVSGSHRYFQQRRDKKTRFPSPCLVFLPPSQFHSEKENLRYSLSSPCWVCYTASDSHEYMIQKQEATSLVLPFFTGLVHYCLCLLL